MKTTVGESLRAWEEKVVQGMGINNQLRAWCEGVEARQGKRLFTEEQLVKMSRAVATYPFTVAVQTDLYEFVAQVFAGVTSKRGEPEPSEEIGKVEVDRLVRARAESVERLAGKKLFTEEQLAEVAKEIETSYSFAKSEFYEGANAPPTPISWPEYVAQAFASTVDKMVESGETYDAVERPGGGGGRTIKFRRYPSITSEFVPPSHKNIIEAIRTMQHAAWENSKAHGWNEAVDNPASALMMITREVSELAEEERDASSGESTKIPGFSKKEEEAADIAIRLLSYCGARNMRLGAAICAKHEFNKTRPYRHGDKLF